MYDPKQEKFQGAGAKVSPEMESLIRKNPEHYDVRLDKTQGVGTDCPQSSTSIGIHMGLLEDASRNSNVMVQEMGRYSRKSTNFRQQDFYMVVNPSVDTRSGSVSDEAATNHEELVLKYKDSHERTETTKKMN